MKKFLSPMQLLVVSLILVTSSFPQIPEGYKKGLEYINKGDLQRFISVLADDSLKGRAAGTDENLEAARFIAHRFYELGLIPAEAKNGRQYHAPAEDDENTPLMKSNKEVEPDYYDKYFQKFFVLDTKLDVNNSLKLISNFSTGRKEIQFDYRNDFIIDYKYPQNISLSSEVVFVGYGIDNGPNKYSDYETSTGEKIDVKNKIVLMLEGYPQQDDTLSAFNQNKKGAVTYNVKKKTALAMEKGALAVLVAKSPLKASPPFIISSQPLYNAFSGKNYTLPELKAKESIPLIYINNNILKELLSGLSKNLDEELQNVEPTLKPISHELKDKNIQLDIRFDNNLIPSENVVGFIEGNDPVLKNEFVVVGAHFDHVGLGKYGAMNKKDVGKIHNGADDNASGTAGMMELAEAFSHCKPKRSIVFIAFNAEEMGMLGSRYYAYQNPLKNIEKTVGMVNLDMISRNDPKLVWAGGIFYSSDMKKIIEEANKEIGFEVLYNVGLFTFASDQGPFIRKKVPSVFFFGGLHDDYHTPNDKINRLDFDKVEKISKLGFVSAWLLANTDDLPKYREMTMDEKIVLVKESGERQKKYQSEEKK
ncbi:MAG: M20/M25/M40 family metallo-hydrolase [Ignavibacteria bacterium]|nr:M20/M25/M40 family metallo-hydrolase [Ignavibacteria bacterium]